jgi:phosphohistidine swiveling domain-containing protein
MKSLIKNNERWFPIITRRGAVLLVWLESRGLGEKLLEFTNLDLTELKEICIIKDIEYTRFLEGNGWAKIQKKFEERLRTDKNYLNKIFKKIYLKLSKLEKFSQPKDLTKNTNLELSNLILTYTDLYSDISPFYITYFGIRPILKEKTENWLKERVPIEKLQDYHITLTTPCKKPYAGEEDEALQKIIKMVKLNKRIRKLFENNLNKILKELPKISPKIFKKLQSHLKSYYWVPVERDNPSWKIEDILSRIRYGLKRGRKKIKEKESLIKRQKRYEKQLKIPSQMMINFQMLREFMIAVDAMKKTYAISHCFLSDLLDEIAKRLEIRKSSLFYLTPYEISKILKTKSKISKREIELRKSCISPCYWFKKKWQIKIIKGQRAKSIIKKLIKPKIVKKEEIIKGVSASPGKVVGLAKIVKDRTEINKLSQDEILVTPMTTPDYISAIHKASAIITDEGGVLCHAVIISREFGIPCVIGTKIATKVLKDGDLVEVDANKGIVKKLK